MRSLFCPQVNMKVVERINEKTWLALTGGISILLIAIIGYLLFNTGEFSRVNSRIYLLPQFNAILNSATFLLLLTGYFLIRQKKINAHKTVMVSAFIFSVIFLVSYLVYHSNAPHTSFGGNGWSKTIYYFILSSHIILAVAIVPMVLITLYRALSNNFSKHKKIAKWTLPVWLYVSLTGVIVYLMIAPYYPV